MIGDVVVHSLRVVLRIERKWLFCRERVTFGTGLKRNSI
jgi:hypothetical protein